MFGLIIIPDGRLFAVCKPPVFPVRQPAEQHRLMLPLIRAAAQYQRVLYPDAHAGNMETGFFECPAEIKAFCIRMKDICGSTLRKVRKPVPECRQQKFIELLICHAVILNGLAIGGFIRNVVRRVRHNQVCLCIPHEQVQVALCGGIPAQHFMPSQCPQIPGLYERFNIFSAQFRLIVLHILVMHFAEQFIHFCGIEPCRTDIVARYLQVTEQICECFRFPFADSLIQGNVQRLLILRVFDMHNNAVNLRNPFCSQYFISLMPADNITCHLIPDNGIHVTEVMHASFDLFIGRITGLQVFSRIVLCGL